MGIYQNMYTIILYFYNYLTTGCMSRIDKINKQSRPNEYFTFINNLRAYESKPTKRTKINSYTISAPQFITNQSYIDIKKPLLLIKRQIKEKGQVTNLIKDADNLMNIEKEDIEVQICNNAEEPLIQSAQINKHEMINALQRSYIEINNKQQDKENKDSFMPIQIKAEKKEQFISQQLPDKNKPQKPINQNFIQEEPINKQAIIQAYNQPIYKERKQSKNQNQAHKLSYKNAKKLINQEGQCYGREWRGNVKISLRVLERLQRQNHLCK